MTVQQLVNYVRLSVICKDPDNDGCTDKAYLEMTDEEIRLYLEVCLTRDFSSVPSLERLPNAYVYPLTLLVKKEIYYALAVYVAPQVDITADQNNNLRRSQRFEHYMALIKQVDKEYQDWLDNGGGLNPDDGSGAVSNTLSSYDVLLPNTRYFTKRYHEKGMKPAPQLYVDNTTESEIELHWVNRCRQFGWCNVYVSTTPITDLYKVGSSKVVDADCRVFHTIDARQTTYRIEGLDSGTQYFVAVEVVDKSGLTGISEECVYTQFVEDESSDQSPVSGESENEEQSEDVESATSDNTESSDTDVSVLDTDVGEAHVYSPT